MGLGGFQEGLHPATVLRRTGTTATGTDRTVLAFLGGEVCPDLLDPQVKAPAGGEVVVVGESFGAPQAKIAQPNPPRIITDAGTPTYPLPNSRHWTTTRCRCVRVQPEAICSTACRPAIVVSAGISSRRQISGLTPRTTTRNWYTLGKGAGCMVSGMAPILASRCGRMAPGTVPPTVCPALVADLGSGKRPPVTVTINGHTYRTSVAPMGGAAQPLPSGSSKKTKEPHGNSWTSLTCTPRAVSSARGVDVGDHHLQSPDSTRLCVGDTGAERDRTRRSRRGELHEPDLVRDPVVVIGMEADLVGVEGLRAVHIGDWNSDQFQLPVHARRLPAQRSGGSDATVAAGTDTRLRPDPRSDSGAR